MGQPNHRHVDWLRFWFWIWRGEGVIPYIEFNLAKFVTVSSPPPPIKFDDCPSTPHVTFIFKQYSIIFFVDYKENLSVYKMIRRRREPILKCDDITGYYPFLPYPATNNAQKLDKKEKEKAHPQCKFWWDLLIKNKKKKKRSGGIELIFPADP